MDYLHVVLMINTIFIQLYWKLGDNDSELTKEKFLLYWCFVDCVKLHLTFHQHGGRRWWLNCSLKPCLSLVWSSQLTPCSTLLWPVLISSWSCGRKLTRTLEVTFEYFLPKRQRHTQCFKDEPLLYVASGADMTITVTLRQTVQHYLFLYKSCQRNSKSWSFITLQAQATYTTNPFGVQLKQANYTKSHVHVCSECLVQIFSNVAIMVSYVQYTQRTVITLQLKRCPL